MKIYALVLSLNNYGTMYIPVSISLYHCIFYMQLLLGLEQKFLSRSTHLL